MTTHTTISPKRCAQFLVCLVLGLTLLSIAGSLSLMVKPFSTSLGHEIQESFVRLFYLDAEANIPTWYSASALLCCAILLFVIARAQKAQQKTFVSHWQGLSCIFLALSIDEGAIIHEMAIKPMRSIVDASGIFHYAWIVPGAIAILFFVIAYLRFFWHLPTRTRYLFFIAGITYVGGAIGVEALSGLAAAQYGEGDIEYVILATIEELMEMMGIVIFIYALLDFADQNKRVFSFSMANQQPASNAKNESNPFKAPHGVPVPTHKFLRRP